MGALAKAMGVAISDRSMVPAATILSATDAEGIELLLQKAQEYREKSPEHRMSALQDLLAHRPLEVHETVGEALLKARALGIEMPYSETLYQITAAIGRIEHR
jgi:ketopantoate reductase